MTLQAKEGVKIFINHVDEYHGYHISKFISECVVGASVEPEEEEEEGSGNEENPSTQKKDCFYEVYGSLKKQDATKPDFVKGIVSLESRERLYQQLLDFDIIIYDITQFNDQIDESMWVLSELHHNIETLEKRKMFILLSTLMTWAGSEKPANEQENSDEPLKDEDYKKRKPHPNYKDHMLAEKTTVKYGNTRKSRLLTYIVNAGLTYGCGERVFHSLFKAAWHNAEALPVYSDGKNSLPMIHVKDLAAILQNIIDRKPEIKYIVAVDDSPGQTLAEVVKTISESLATGKLNTVTKEEAVLSNEIDQSSLDQLTMSLKVDAEFVKQEFNINWVCETGILESAAQIVKEYKIERGLLPVKACVLGPPAVGKSTLVKQLCKHYALHHVTIKMVIEEAIARMERSAARTDAEEEGDDDGKAADDAETLEQVKECLAENDGRLTDEFVTRFFREKLSSKPCQNQGFILDGFPRNKEEAIALFQKGEDDDEEEEEAEEENDEIDGEDNRSSNSNISKKLMPDHFFLMQAPDSFVKQRVMELPECEVAGTHNTEEGLMRRLAEFHKREESENSAMEFFEANELQPHELDAASDTSPMHSALVEVAKEIIGKPRNYGLTEQQIQEIQLRQQQLKQDEERQIRDEFERREREEAEIRSSRQMEWQSRLEESKQQEQQLLQQRSEPLREYLLTHVMPSLSKGLIECANSRPDDAVDYLAEFLFRNNPQVD